MILHKSVGKRSKNEDGVVKHTQQNTNLTNSFVILWEQIGELIAVQAIREKFGTGGIENIYCNPSSTSAAPDYVLHGTSITKIQQFTDRQDNPPESSMSLIQEKKQMGKNRDKTMPTSLDRLHVGCCRRNQTISCLCRRSFHVSQSDCPFSMRLHNRL